MSVRTFANLVDRLEESLELVLSPINRDGRIESGFRSVSSRREHEGKRLDRFDVKRRKRCRVIRTDRSVWKKVIFIH